MTNQQVHISFANPAQDGGGASDSKWDKTVKNIM